MQMSKRIYKNKDSWFKKKITKFLKEKDVEESNINKEATDAISKRTLHSGTI